MILWMSEASEWVRETEKERERERERKWKIMCIIERAQSWNKCLFDEVYTLLEPFTEFRRGWDLIDGLTTMKGAQAE
jgi:hypothetical protein